MAAKEALHAELAKVEPDNPVAAVRTVARVARQLDLPCRSAWDGFRWAAQQAVEPFFERRDMPPAMAAVWAVTDPYYGQLLDNSSSRNKRDPNRRDWAAGVREALTGAVR